MKEFEEEIPDEKAEKITTGKCPLKAKLHTHD